MNKKQLFTIGGIVVGGVSLALLILLSGGSSRERSGDEHGHGETNGHSEEEGPHGPHGGRLVQDQDGFALEATIYETGIPPEFRFYPYENGQDVNPKETTLTVELHRLGGDVDTIRFAPAGQYLRGDRVVREPHSFDVKIRATRNGKTYAWEYASHEGRVRIADDAAERAGISIVEAGPAIIETGLDVPGEIAFNADRQVHVVPRFGGVVVDVRKNQGDFVRGGEVIAIIDSRELAEAKDEYIRSVHRLEYVQSIFEREEQLWTKKIGPEQDYLAALHELEEAEIATQVAEQKLVAVGIQRAMLERLAAEPEGSVQERREVRRPFAEGSLTRYEIRAPIDGVVIEKHISLGEAIREDATVFVIADLSTVWVNATVYSRDVNRVRSGQKAFVRSEETGMNAVGTLSYVGPVVGEETRAARARVVLPNPDGRWRPGQFVSVRLIESETQVPLAVRTEAVQSFRDFQVVFARHGDEFEVRMLELGRSDGEHTEVLGGIASGESYAATNSYVIKADLEKAGATHDH